MQFKINKEDLLNDYNIAVICRQYALKGRRETLNGKAKFGIFGDGKELPQIVLSKFIKKGDYFSGYYRDQILPFCLGVVTLENLYAQLLGDTIEGKDTSSGGRSMIGHISTSNVSDQGFDVSLLNKYNFSSDVSSVAGQCPKTLGFGLASKIFKKKPALASGLFSQNGNEICVTTIGDAATSEGIFFETINAAAVMQIPIVFVIWDDGYGISVPSEYHSPNSDISDALSGFEKTTEKKGINFFKVKAHDYIRLHEVFGKAIDITRNKHIPTLVHVSECTQPTGHSTSGSHEKYKTKERMRFETEKDTIKILGDFILSEKWLIPEGLKKIEVEAIQYIDTLFDKVFKNFKKQGERKRTQLQNLIKEEHLEETFTPYQAVIQNSSLPKLATIQKTAKLSALKLKLQKQGNKILDNFISENQHFLDEAYNTKIYHPLELASIVPPQYSENPHEVDGTQIIRDNFDFILNKDEKVVIFGEDCGAMGDVNHGLKGLQSKYGKERVFDTGIRETTIVGQATGMAFRGLRPIAEIQYLDYLVYALQTIIDDIACMYYRTDGKAVAPVIIRTRGHRLEGIWHSGSPMGMILNAVRGMYVLVPRNFTQAAGMYNHLLQICVPAILIEPLNSYRIKEKYPLNMGNFMVDFGTPEILMEGDDFTVVTYGPCCKIALEALKILEENNLHGELIDVQTLLPFDKNKTIVESIKKTGKILFLDEDVPGGSSAFMLQQTLIENNGYDYLETKPMVISAKNHRPAYGTNGDYASKPNINDIIDGVLELMDM